MSCNDCNEGQEKNQPTTPYFVTMENGLSKPSCLQNYGETFWACDTGARLLRQAEGSSARARAGEVAAHREGGGVGMGRGATSNTYPIFLIPGLLLP